MLTAKGPNVLYAGPTKPITTRTRVPQVYLMNFPARPIIVKSTYFEPL